MGAAAAAAEVGVGVVLGAGVLDAAPEDAVVAGEAEVVEPAPEAVFSSVGIERVTAWALTKDRRTGSGSEGGDGASSAE